MCICTLYFSIDHKFTRKQHKMDRFINPKVTRTPKSLKTSALSCLADCDTIGEVFPKLSVHSLKFLAQYSRLGPVLAQKLSPAPLIKKILPHSLYLDYLHEHLESNSLNWEAFLREVLKCNIEDIQDFDFSNLSAEEAIIVKTYPYKTYDCCDNAILVSCLYSCIDKFKNICLHCVNQYKIQNTTICSDAYVLQKIDLPSLFKYNWCSHCQMQPLFQFISFDKDDYEMPILKKSTQLNLKVTYKRPPTKPTQSRRCIKRTKSY